MKLSLICPCYNESENIQKFFEACLGVLEDQIKSYEFVFINDGSKDGTWKKLQELYETHSANIKLINFSRNFGKEAAMYAGLQKAEGEYISIIDTDLQQPPEKILEMVEFLDRNVDFDCVVAYQEKRNECKLISGLKNSFYKVINAVSEINFQSGASDFRTFRKSVKEAILSLGECHRFLKGIFSWVGFNTHYIPYVAEERNAGKTSWSFLKLWKYAMGGIISFSTLPLKVATFVGSIFSLFSLIYMVCVIVQKLAFGISVPGYATLVVLILLIGGVQLLCIGVLGEYVSRIYIQGKQRPICIVKEYKSKKSKEL